MSSPSVFTYIFESYTAVQLFGLWVSFVYKQSDGWYVHLLGFVDGSVEQRGCHALAAAAFEYGNAVDVEFAWPGFVFHV